jgi:hypothetical protein
MTNPAGLRKPISQKAARLSLDPLQDLRPLTPAESHRCFATPQPEFDALAAHCASLPVPIPEDLFFIVISRGPATAGS